MKAIHGDKHKNDKLDAQKIAHLLRAGLIPYAHACSADMRHVRDLLRQRQHLVQWHSQLLTRTKMTFYQIGLIDTEPLSLRNRTQRQALVDMVPDPFTRLVCSSNTALMKSLHEHIRDIERVILQHARDTHGEDLALLLSVPGIGPIIGLTILYELDNFSRFSRRQQFSSYCRLAKPVHTSDNKPVGLGNRKCGSPYLKWAFMEIISNAVANSDAIKTVHNHLKARYEPLKARAILATHFCMIVYYMLKKKKPFDEQRFKRSFPEAFSTVLDTGHLQPSAA
jgi:transposase